MMMPLPHLRRGPPALTIYAEMYSNISSIRYQCGTASCCRKAEPVSTGSTKLCGGCGEVREAKWFFVDKQKSSGLGTMCMPCGSLRGQQQREMNRVRSQGQQQPAEKQCRDCERLLPIGNFGRDYGYKDGISTQCKECLVKVQNVSRANRMVRFGGQLPGAPPPDVRICTQCKQIKPYSEFSRNRAHTTSGIRSFCKICYVVQQQQCKRDRARDYSARQTSGGDTLSTPEC